MICSIMSTAPAPAETDPGSPAPWERALLDRQLERLDQLADMGLALAGDTDISHAAIDFARVSRAVRMTLALQSRLVRDFKMPIKAAGGNADNDDGPVQWEVQWIDEPPTQWQQRDKVRGVVRSVGEDSGLDTETVERLDAEGRERLERDDIYADIVNRPVSDIVADICRDLGLNPDWGGLIEQGWAKEEISRGKVGWPLAALRAARRPAPPDAGSGLDSGLRPPFHGSS
jgi:hypothetical protein